MNKRIFLVGFLAFSLATGARAGTTYFDSVTVTGTDANAGSDGYSESSVGDGGTLLAESFTAPAADFADVSFTLSAANPSDGGSTLVYLVADDGAGGGIGIAGNPTYAPGGTSFTNFTNSQLIGSIADSSLTSSPTETALLWIDSSAVAAVAAATQNQEYWIVLDTTNSSADWYYNSGTPEGLGASNQGYWNNVSNNYGASGGFGSGSGPYEMIVASIPEPTSVGLLGLALGGLGVFGRKRNRSRA